MIGKREYIDNDTGATLTDVVEIWFANNVYNISRYTVYPDGSKKRNLAPGAWADSMAAAKRRVFQFSAVRSKDFVWEKEEGDP